MASTAQTQTLDSNTTPEVAAIPASIPAISLATLVTDDDAGPIASEIADTEEINHTLQSSNQLSPSNIAPAWLLELAHQLKNFRMWRFIIRPDNTIDIDYLASLAFQAQRKARNQPPTPQLALFPSNAISNVNTDTPFLDLTETTAMTTNLAHVATEPKPFAVLTGQQTRPDTITLPAHVLTIEADEELNDFLARVAQAAVAAAITTYGSQPAAFARLGSKTPDSYPGTASVSLTSPRPTLVLAPTRKS